MRVIVTLSIVSWGAFAQASRGYAGPVACKTCHPAIYNRWSKTLMANVVRDPNVHPDAILPDVSKPDPLVKFTKDDVAFVYGSKWKQRYFTKKGYDYYPLDAQWMFLIRFGEPTKAHPVQIGGRRFIPTTICSGPPARCVTGATQ